MQNIKPILLIVLSIVCVTCSQPIGNMTPAANSSCYTDPKMHICFFVTDIELTVTMTSHFYGYFALLYEHHMQSGDFTVIQLQNGTLTLGDYHSPGGHSKPIPDTTNNLALIESETDGTSYVSVKFTRLLDTGDIQDRVLQRGMNFQFTYAKREGSLVLAKHMHGEYVEFKGVLENGITFNGEEPENIRDLLFYHGLTLTILWFLLADIAIWVKFQLWIQGRAFIHGILMGMCVVVSALAITQMIQQMEPAERILEIKPKVHYFNARVIFVWVIIQALGGMTSRLLQPKPTVSPGTQQLVRKMHRYSGYSLVVLAKVNVMIGWTMYNKLIALAVLCFQSLLLYLQWKLYLRVTWGDVSTQVFSNPKEVLVNSAGSAGIEHNLLFQPYNCNEVQSARFIIFDDLVFKVPETNFHPGGQKIIQMVLGRQVDRFLYGLSHLQLYPELPPFPHPSKSLQILGDPCGFIPASDICKLTTQTFKLKQRINITPHLSIFYFKPVSGTVKFNQATSLRHLGQYYTVKGFGKTRLYTSVISQRKEYKERRERVLKMLTPANKRLSQEIKQQFLEGVDSTEKDVEMQHIDPETLPLLIKRYVEPNSFTNQLYGNMGTTISISGPKGRGLCIQALPKGEIAIIAGGTGIFPFLDLIDILFRLVSDISMSQPQRILYSSLLQDRTFTFFLSVVTVGDLVMPDQLSYLAHAKHPLVRVFVRISQDSVAPSGFMEELLNSHESFGDRFVAKYILPMTNLVMVYICGKQKMYKETEHALREAGLPAYKIFFV